MIIRPIVCVPCINAIMHQCAYHFAWIDIGAIAKYIRQIWRRTFGQHTNNFNGDSIL